jgi:hypothetical protein
MERFREHYGAKAMRSVLILGAAAIMIPVAVAAQSNAGSSQSTAGQSGPVTGQPGPEGSSNDRADPMGDTANPVASDTHLDQRSGVGPSPSMSSGSANYPTCSRTIRDQCRNRGGR